MRVIHHDNLGGNSNMRFHVTALALTVGLLWGVVVFLVAAANTIWPTYGQAFLELVASIYPGYHASPGLGSALIGASYGFLDGAIGGAVLAWVYNLLADRLSRKTA